MTTFFFIEKRTTTQLNYPDFTVAKQFHVSIGK